MLFRIRSHVPDCYRICEHDNCDHHEHDPPVNQSDYHTRGLSGCQRPKTTHRKKQATRQRQVPGWQPKTCALIASHQAASHTNPDQETCQDKNRHHFSKTECCDPHRSHAKQHSLNPAWAVSIKANPDRNLRSRCPKKIRCRQQSQINWLQHQFRLEGRRQHGIHCSEEKRKEISKGKESQYQPKARAAQTSFLKTRTHQIVTSGLSSPTLIKVTPGFPMHILRSTFQTNELSLTYLFRRHSHSKFRPLPDRQSGSGYRPMTQPRPSRPSSSPGLGRAGWVRSFLYTPQRQSAGNPETSRPYWSRQRID